MRAGKVARHQRLSDQVSTRQIAGLEAISHRLSYAFRQGPSERALLRADSRWHAGWDGYSVPRRIAIVATAKAITRMHPSMTGFSWGHGL
jgi:hypothetical protein